jgi:hypothetical protein
MPGIITDIGRALKRARALAMSGRPSPLTPLDSSEITDGVTTPCEASDTDDDVALER